MPITISVFERSPDQGKGLARDMPVRWALEEAGLPYAVRLVSFTALKEPAHRATQPFGQIPTYEEDGLVLFESGAIVHHIALRHPGLLPTSDNARARAVTWMFAAVGTIEPPVVEWSMASLLERDEDWFARRRPMLVDRVHTRLRDLARHLSDSEWLDGEFSAADLLMVSVLRRLKGSDLLEAHPDLTAYIARGEARPAFQRAFAAQLAQFQAGQPADR
jgi:glutathione S-transferase